MSFILDALKKSESDRQRQTGPALFEVKVTPPKSQFPPWAVAIAVLLGVNMMVVAWLILRHPSHAVGNADLGSNPGRTAAVAAAAPGFAPGASPGASPLPGPAPTPATASAPISTSASAPPGAAPNAPGASTTVVPGVASTPGTATGQATPGTGAGSGPAFASGPGSTTALETTPGAGPVSGSGNGTDSAPATINPDDYVPAADPAGQPLFKGHLKRGTESGLMLYQDAAMVPGANLPPLRLDLHVYAAKPEDRFALINMHKLREGDSLPEGVRVESITADGVVMSHNGLKFILPRD